MDRADIEREIRRLAPWYYLLDLGGVSTGIVGPCDEAGHREVSCPQIWPGFWAGRTVLDVACNEGAWSFGALRHGAAHVDAFDARPINIEKAAFAANVLGHTRVRFQVATCESWVACAGDRKYDVVFLCGILYHLPDPCRVIEMFCDIARSWIYVSSCVQGKPDRGWTRTNETENVAASHMALASQMPNNAGTLISEFARHGFICVHVEEVSRADYWDGCNLLLRRCRGDVDTLEADDGDPAVDLFIARARDVDAQQRPVWDVFVTAYNRGPRPLAIEIAGRIRHGDGRVTELGAETWHLPPRSSGKSNTPSQSKTHRVTVPMDSAAGAVMEVTARGAGTGHTVARRVFGLASR